MVKTITSKIINLTQLDEELGNFGLCLNEEDPTKKIVAVADGSALTLAELEAGVAAHVAVFPVPSLEEKLASVGLSIEELKAALA